MELRRTRIAFVLIGVWIALAPSLIPSLSWLPVNVADWLTLWGVSVLIGGFLIVFGLTLKGKAEQSKR